MKNRQQILFLSHGGGPLPLLGDKGHVEMVECLQKIALKIKKPSAILVVSAHWEEAIATITAAARPALIYDYYGFPEESYHIKYPCSGDPLLAKQVHQHIEDAGIAARLDHERGFDHGLFVPLKIMFPDADIPCVQLSLNHNLDPTEHLNMGKALTKLENNELLVVGSGFSFHNMKEFFAAESKASNANNEAFEEWLIETCSSPGMDIEERHNRLINWEAAPAARFCHPREEHLLPLHFCCGVAQAACDQHFELKILNKKSSMYLWSKPNKSDH